MEHFGTAWNNWNTLANLNERMETNSQLSKIKTALAGLTYANLLNFNKFLNADSVWADIAVVKQLWQEVMIARE